MKKPLILALILTLCALFVGCNNTTADNKGTSNNPANETIESHTSETETTNETYSNKPNAPTLPEGALTSDEAVDISLKKANLNKEDIIGLWSELDYDNGVLIYEVDFSDGRYDYDCDVDANTGKILHFEKELDD